VNNSVPRGDPLRIADIARTWTPSQPTVATEGQTYVRLENKTFIPQTVYERVQASPAWGLRRNRRTPSTAATST